MNDFRRLEFIRQNIEFFKNLNFPSKSIFLSYFWILPSKYQEFDIFEFTRQKYLSRICSYIGSEMWWDIHDFHWRDPIVQKVRRSRISDWPGFHICWNSPKTTGFLRDKVTKTPNWPILKEKVNKQLTFKKCKQIAETINVNKQLRLLKSVNNQLTYLRNS